MPQSFGSVLRQVLANQESAEHETDRELLQRFAITHDEAAFAILVRRHGPMILGVCQRILGDVHAAQDAFQATFLALVHRAHHLDRRATLGGWLYTVAYHAAVRARHATARRRYLETQAVAMKPTHFVPDPAHAELGAVIDQELTRLPEKYRVPLVLCYLEGKTTDEAAGLLGWTKGTVSGRLARAREVLNSRLTKRGLALAAGLAPLSMGSAVSAALLEATVSTALASVSQQIVAAPIAALAEGALQNMAISKIKMTVAASLVVIVVTAAGFLLRADGRSHAGMAEFDPALLPGRLGGPQGLAQLALAADRDDAATAPIDAEDRIGVSFIEETQRFGIAILKLQDPRYPEKPKLLTRFERGNSSNTCLRIDASEYLFGSEGKNAAWKLDDKVGRTLRGVHSKQDRKIVSVMRYDREQIEVTQIVEIVVGEQTRLFDTALVTYVIENHDDQPHTVSLRALIDTYIGLTDGTPFLIPPTADNLEAQLIDTKIELAKGSIPPFIRALENDRMNDPNTAVAEMGLKIKGYENIDKLVICRWPQEAGGSNARWQWPYTAMNQPRDEVKDSCVVLYWPKVTMAPKTTRKMGYTYGLGRINNPQGEEAFTANSQGKIKLAIGPGARQFVAAAYVKKADGQKCTLKLPAGLKFAPGESPAKPVKTEANKDYAVVTWLVEGNDVGKYTLDAVLEDGADAKANIHVLEDSIFK